MDSLNSLRWMSVLSACTLLPACVKFEGVDAITVALWSAYRESDLRLTLCANCIGAFLVNFTQFLVTERIGALSMQVLGNLKTMVTVIFSVCIFKNAFNMQNFLGYGITMVGSFVYLRVKKIHGRS